MKNRTCTKCGITKELSREHFHRDVKSRDSYAVMCKPCKNLRGKPLPTHTVPKIQPVKIPVTLEKDSRRVSYSKKTKDAYSAKELAKVFHILFEKFGKHYSVCHGANGIRIQSHGAVSINHKAKTPEEALGMVL